MSSLVKLTKSTLTCAITGTALLAAVMCAMAAARGKRLHLPSAVSRLTRRYTNPVTVSQPTAALAATEPAH